MTNDQKTALLTKLQQLIEGSPGTALLGQLIDDAEAWALAYTGRTYIPDRLMLNTIGDLAVIAYNRLGTEGETSRTEGGERYDFETAPARVTSILNRYRLARVGGSYHETAEKEQA